MASPPGFLETLHKDLALALGDAVWAFARIEWAVHEYLRRLSADRLDELLGDLNFRPRTTILRRLVERSKAVEPVKAKAISTIGRAESLADRRNLIVHNPWRIWIDLNASEFMTEIQKYSNPSKKIDLNALVQFAEECGQVEQALKESLSAL